MSRPPNSPDKTPRERRPSPGGYRKRKPQQRNYLLPQVRRRRATISQMDTPTATHDPLMSMTWCGVPCVITYCEWGTYHRTDGKKPIEGIGFMCIQPVHLAGGTEKPANREHRAVER